MRGRIPIVGAGLVACAFLLPATSSATVVTTGCANAGVSCTLAELAGGASMTIADVLFSAWSVDDFSSVPVDLTAVEVLALDDAANPGVRYVANGPLDAAGLDLVDLGVGFDVAAALPALRVVGNSLEITDFAFDAGNFGGFIVVFEDLSGGVTGGKQVFADNLPPPVFDLFDALAFAPTASLTVDTFVLVGGDATGDATSLRGLEQRFAVAQVSVPAPATVSLLLLGLLVLPMSRRGVPAAS